MSEQLTLFITLHTDEKDEVIAHNINTSHIIDMYEKGYSSKTDVILTNNIRLEVNETVEEIHKIIQDSIESMSLQALKMANSISLKAEKMFEEFE